MKRRETGIHFPTKSLTQQHFKDECDINRIVRRYDDSQVWDHVQNIPPQYGFASSQSFSEAMQTVTLATEEFSKFPAKIRAHFSNDPGAYLDALQNPTQRQGLIDLGIFSEAPGAPPSEASEEIIKEPEPAPNEPSGE